MLEILYVALPSGPLPDSVQMKVPGSKMAPRPGSEAQTIEIYEKILKKLLENHLA